MANSKLPLEAIGERDMDLLLLEELHVSPDFGSWLVAKTYPSDVTFAKFVSARHSVVEGNGESDVEFVFEDAQGHTLALLVEDKISAAAQPDQALRYGQRAKKSTEAGWSQAARTCMVAPHRYLETSSDAAGYDARVTYEDIAAWFQDRANLDARAGYKADFVRAAIEQARRGYKVVKDEQVTDFWLKYWKDVSSLFPELELEEPGERGSQATWVVFGAKSLRKKRTLYHKLTMGAVDLSTELPASRVAELTRGWAPLLHHDMSVEGTGKSLSVRVKVRELDIRADYHDQVDAARAGMRAAYRLLYLSPALVAP